MITLQEFTKLNTVTREEYLSTVDGGVEKEFNSNGVQVSEKNREGCWRKVFNKHNLIVFEEFFSFPKSTSVQKNKHTWTKTFYDKKNLIKRVQNSDGKYIVYKTSKEKRTSRKYIARGLQKKHAIQNSKFLNSGTGLFREFWFPVFLALLSPGLIITPIGVLPWVIVVAGMGVSHIVFWMWIGIIAMILAFIALTFSLHELLSEDPKFFVRLYSSYDRERKCKLKLNKDIEES